MDLTPALPRIRAPLTVVYGSPDAQARAAIDRSFSSAYASARSARLVRIDGSGHMVMLDQPARFQAVAHCSNGLGFYWEQFGTVGRVRGASSFAECTSLLGHPQISDYHVRWL